MSIAKLLFVDDETAFLDAMKRRLVKRGFDVKTASGGMEALVILEESVSNIEVVILDVKMPVMDGIETLRQIKRKYPMIEVIMLTGHATVDSAIEGMKQGAFDYLMKPAEIDSFTGKIEEAAQKKRQQEQKIVAARMKSITNRRA